MYRQTIDLTGTWRFQPDPAAAGEKLGYQNPENDASTWRNVKVPCCFESCAPGMDAYEGTGWNRHEDSPTADMTTDLITTRRDLLEMKEAGANFVRLCHYPHHPAELDLCDEIGLLVMDEIPLYWWQREDEGKENSLHKFEAASRQIERMIARDRNHPCVILWSVSNENDEEHDDVREGNQALIRLAQGLDPSRLSCHVSYCWMDHHNFSEDDVVCLNAYPSLFRLGPGLFGFGEQDQNNAFSQSTIFWQEGIKTMSETYPGKPVLVTEFGGCAIEGTWSSLYGEDTQATIIECEFAGMEAAAVCGTVIWCWADPTPGLPVHSSMALRSALLASSHVSAAKKLRTGLHAACFARGRACRPADRGGLNPIPSKQIARDNILASVSSLSILRGEV